MKKNLLFSKYLNLYERAYYDKSDGYQKEAERILPFFRPDTKSILDIGSGTGKHAAELLKNGFRVHCIDISRDAVRETTKNIKSRAYGSAELADITNYHSKRKFDAALALFIVFSYVPKEKLDAALKNVYQALRPKGLFIFDLVNGAQLDKRFYKKILVKGDGVNIEWGRVKKPESRTLEACAIIRTNDKTYIDYQTFYYYYPEEIKKILHEIGFKEVAVYSDYLRHKDYVKSKAKLCVVCRK
jgi:SAM-dependent methyltransferase